MNIMTVKYFLSSSKNTQKDHAKYPKFIDDGGRLSHKSKHTQMHRHTDTQTDREIDRLTHTQTDTQTHKETNR